MNFVSKLTEEEYELFVKNNQYKSHFLQSYTWGQFSYKERNLKPHYVGLKDNQNNIVAATLLLEKGLPFGYSYLYSPRGFVMNMEDITLLSKFVQALKIYAKEQKAIFLKVDPDFIIKKTNYLEENVELSSNAENVFKAMKKEGAKHLGFTKNFELNQPRYTFRIDLTQDIDTIKEHFSKTTKQRIKKAEDLEIEVRIAKKEEIIDFYKLMKATENRKDFVSHDLSYYENLYTMWNKTNSCNIFLGVYNIAKNISKLISEKEVMIDELNQLKKIENPGKNQNTRKRNLEQFLEKKVLDIEKQQVYQKEYGDSIILSAHFIIEYGNKAWVLYAGNHNILSETNANYKTYQAHIEYCKEKGIEIYDQFGTIGDLSKENHLLGLHEFKKKFGGDYIEFIGEFDFILNKPIYFVFTKLVPFYRKTIKLLAKRKNKVK